MLWQQKRTKLPIPNIDFAVENITQTQHSQTFSNRSFFSSFKSSFDARGSPFVGLNHTRNFYLTIGSYVSVRSSKYEARVQFGEHERYVRVARRVVESNSSFLRALQTSQVFHISMNAQLTYELIVL